MVLKSAGMVIYRKNVKEIELLLLQYKKGLHWSPIKGAIDKRERTCDAAWRQVKEIGFNSEDLRITTKFEKTLKYVVDGQKKTVTFYIAELILPRQLTLTDKYTAFKWVSIDTALQMVQFNNMVDLLQTCHTMLKKRATIINLKQVDL